MSSESRRTVTGPVADGQPVAGNPVQIGGKDDAGNTQTLRTDTSGNLQIDLDSVSEMNLDRANDEVTAYAPALSIASSDATPVAAATTTQLVATLLEHLIR